MPLHKGDHHGKAKQIGRGAGLDGPAGGEVSRGAAVAAPEAPCLPPQAANSEASLRPPPPPTHHFHPLHTAAPYLPLTPVHRYLFIDRDGTLIEEPPDTQQVDSCERLRLLPRVISVLRLAQQTGGYRLVMITNQDGLGTETFPEADFWAVQRLLTDIFAAEGIRWYGLHIDRSRASAPSFYRKPSPLFLLPYLRDMDRQRSFVIGDRATDMLLAARLGIRGLWLENPLHPRTEAIPGAIPVRDWQAIWTEILRALFSVELRRETKETRIALSLTLYGTGQVSVQTGIGFFDHMLTLLAFHAGWDMTLHAEGDLHVDTHHTIEDVGIVLGQALRQLISEKRGLHRYGQFVQRALPMDEALGIIGVDLSGRGMATWQGTLLEAPGGIPPSLWKHFFETMAREGGITLHIHLQGEDAHHIIEAAFKGVGRSLREALQRSVGSADIPSTKGVL